MRIALDRGSDEPLYRQIQAFLSDSILSGSMAPGTRLPATRALAADLGVSRMTVESAYAELEADGLVAAQVGSGTFVLPPFPVRPAAGDAPGTAWPAWHHGRRWETEGAHAAWTATPLDAAVPAAGHTHPIPFAGGGGDARRFPIDEFRRTIQAVMRRDGTAAVEYGDPRGYPPLRATIAQVLASQGLQASAGNVLVTAGSQAALALVSHLLLGPGDVVVVEKPTYGGALQLFRALGVVMAEVPVDAEGMQLDALEPILRARRPRLIYTIPNFQNPTGTCLSSSRRRQLLALADRHGVPVVEDDFVGDLRYDGRAQPALKALDPGGRVIYASTFSKMLMPGLRVGFLVADGPVYDRLVRYKRAVELATSNLMQRALEAYVTVGRYQAHLRRSCQLYRRRRDAICRAIEGWLPGDLEFGVPAGGLFAWVRLPDGIDAAALLPAAQAEGVAFAPGRDFFVDARDGARTMRLNFAACTVEEIDQGVRRLGRIVTQRYAETHGEARREK
ncbi:MAG TPA: PLP-dependent aminotransferase family protein [Anaerolineae bacterium]|nr:PLP-dependent aminotransferase family protein [Anaerolineae bacterium]